MKYGVIDIGSNSVRLLLNGKKVIRITQLSEGLMLTGHLNDAAMQRTSDAIKELYRFAKSSGADEVFAFATEAVRSAENGHTFKKLLTDESIELDVIDALTESRIGFLGAYTGGIKAALDVGGASSELAVGDEKGVFYSHSLPLGSVRLKDYSMDKNVLDSYIKSRVTEYGKVPPFEELISIGGTSSSLAAIHLGLEPYDPEIIHNYKFYYDDLKNTVDRIFATPVGERKNIRGMHPKKTLILPCGGLLIMGIMEYLNLEYIRLSERDNLEGYLALKGIKE
ncbi:MAG TPA: hypothetical protein PKY53_02890 [Clostridia bacterium]|nr:hypothetical protein [Clostridia bacterium]